MQDTAVNLVAAGDAFRKCWEQCKGLGLELPADLFKSDVDEEQARAREILLERRDAYGTAMDEFKQDKGFIHPRFEASITGHGLIPPKAIPPYNAMLAVAVLISMLVALGGYVTTDSTGIEAMGIGGWSLMTLGVIAVSWPRIKTHFRR